MILTLKQSLSVFITTLLAALVFMTIASSSVSAAVNPDSVCLRQGTAGSSEYINCIQDLEDQFDSQCGGSTPGSTEYNNCTQAQSDDYFGVIVTTNDDGDIVEIDVDDVTVTSPSGVEVINYDLLPEAAEAINPSDGILDRTGEPVTSAGRCIDGKSFFDFPTWYSYLNCDSLGGIDQDIEPNEIWLIGIAILEIILRISVFVAFIMVIYGGFKYMTSQGAPEATSSARKTITASLVGMAIAIMATVIVRFSMTILGGDSSVSDGIQVPGADANTSTVQTVLNFVYAVAGAVSVIYVVIGGIKFITSTGDSAKVASARNTVIYAVVGLLIVISAFLITSAVIEEVIKPARIPDVWRLFV